MGMPLHTAKVIGIVSIRRCLMQDWQALGWSTSPQPTTTCTHMGRIPPGCGGDLRLTYLHFAPPGMKVLWHRYSCYNAIPPRFTIVLGHSRQSCAPRGLLSAERQGPSGVAIVRAGHTVSCSCIICLHKILGLLWLPKFFSGCDCQTVRSAHSLPGWVEQVQTGCALLSLA